MTSLSEFAATLIDCFRVIHAIPRVEICRRFLGPAKFITHFRRLGRAKPHRTAAGRLRLVHVVESVDARMPGGGNCYRRALLEIIVDPDAAAEPLHLGLNSHGGPRSGHAWLGNERVSQERYELELTV